MKIRNITAQWLSIIPQSDNMIVFDVKMEYEDIEKLLNQIDFDFLEEYVKKNRVEE